MFHVLFPIEESNADSSRLENADTLSTSKALATPAVRRIAKENNVSKVLTKNDCKNQLQPFQ